MEGKAPSADEGGPSPPSRTPKVAKILRVCGEALGVAATGCALTDHAGLWLIFKATSVATGRLGSALDTAHPRRPKR
jgi:hypothetical protein